MRRRDTGILGEMIARDFLVRNGYSIVGTNYRCPAGEIDIIARQEDILVFFEVRTKTCLQFGTPEESITHEKAARLRTVAAHYLQTQASLPALWRIDVVAIELNNNLKVSRIELIENAVVDI